MEHWRNDTVTVQTQLASENLSLYLFVRHRPQVQLPQIKVVLPSWEAGD